MDLREQILEEIEKNMLITMTKIVSNKFGRLTAKLTAEIFQNEFEAELKKELQQELHTIIAEYKQEIASIFRYQMREFIDNNEEYVKKTVQGIITSEFNSVRMFHGMTFNLKLNKE